MGDVSRVLRKLRRQVYREIPAATPGLAAEIDWRKPYAVLADSFAKGDRGVGAAGAATALWRAATDAGFRAWRYDFGIIGIHRYSVTVIEAGGRLEVHDAYLNHGYRSGFYAILDRLRRDRLPEVRRETRDRKLYLADPDAEPRESLDWLAVHADRELEPAGAVRRFALRWDEATFGAVDRRFADAQARLEEHGYPPDLAYLMLHPIAVFDGVAEHRDRSRMPLLGGRDLGSPTAALRAALRGLASEIEQERRQRTERRGREAELAAATSEAAAAQRRADELERELMRIGGERDRDAVAWEGERRALAAALAAAARETAVAREHIAAGRALLGEWREAFDRLTRERVRERAALRAALEALADDKQRLEAELAQVRSELAATAAATARRTARFAPERGQSRQERQTPQRRRWRPDFAAVLRLFTRSAAEGRKLGPATGRPI